ncbi:hypothetical protein [Bremerella cremea]|uniref:hypothetical protein n=1 Tax=Bremerella cremea TaxID=1031537 RepID=UPI0031E68327
MRTTFVPLLLAIVLLVGSGCREPSPPSVTPVATPAEVEPAQEEVAAVPEVSIEDAAIPVAGLPFELEPYVEPQRLLVFVSSGPIRVDVCLWIDNQPFDQALEELIDHILKLADSDQDGRATWDELADHPQLGRGQFGNLSFEDPRQRQQNINRYDTNRNGWVDRSEVPRLVSRSSARTEAFSVRRTSYAAQRSRTDSTLRQLIDQNGNGTLEHEEIELAAERIQQRDLDDNEIVSVPELMTSMGQMPSDMSRNDRRRFFGGQAMFTLSSDTPWNDLLYAMQQNYVHGQRLDLKQFPPENLLHQIDRNQDGNLSNDELQQLVDLPAQYVLTIRFGERDDRPRLTFEPQPGVGGETLTSEEQLTCHLGNDWLVFKVRDGVNLEQLEQQASSLLELYDRNRDGYLEPDELPDEGAPITFMAADQDNDNKVYAQEIEVALKQQNWFDRCHIRLQGIDGEDPLFRSVDQNRDQRLSARELGQLATNLLAIDQNQSNAIEFDEIPALLEFEFFRGDQDNAAIVTPGYSQPPSRAQGWDSAPAWFVGMDYNGDGDISPREFLGTPQQFQKLDLDQDGFVTGTEALIGK